MSDQRRNLSDVIELNPQVDSFIQEGVTISKAASPTKSKAGRLLSTTQPKNEAKDELAGREGKRKGSQKKPNARIVDTQWTKTAMSKATIQKTVRFNPQLIARWEQLTQSARENGQSPKSFQQVQNEALLLWLENN